MAEVEIRDLRETHSILDITRSPSWDNKRKAGLVIIGDFLSITRDDGGNMLIRLDSGYTIEMSSSPIGQVLAALKLGNKHAEEITLVKDETLVITDIRAKEEIATGNIINCQARAFEKEYFVKLKLDTGYSIDFELKQEWLDKICKEDR